MEELSEVIAETPLFKLFGYAILYNKISVREIMSISARISSSIRNHRDTEGGRFRVDGIILDAAKASSEKLAIEEMDIQEDMEEERLREYPSDILELMKGSRSLMPSGGRIGNMGGLD